MSINEISAKVNDLRELRRMADELNAEIETIQDSIKAHMDAEGVDEIRGLDYKVTWKTVQSKRFDKNAMIDAYGQACYDGFCKQTSTRRFIIA